MGIPASRRKPVVLLSISALVAGFLVAGSASATATVEGAGTVSVTDLTAPPAVQTLTRLQVGTVTLTFTIASTDGQALKPVVLDNTSGTSFAGVTAALTSGDRTDGTWDATVTLASFMDGKHHPRVRVCPTKDTCVSRALSTTIVVNGSDWPELGRITQRPHRLHAGDVTGASAHGRVVFSDSRDPARGMSVRLVRHLGEPGQLVATTSHHGRFTAPWPWTGPGQDPARVVLLAPTVSGAPFDRAVLGNPDTRFHVSRPKAKELASTNKRYVVTGKVTPGYPASRLGGTRLQLRTSSGWKTRDVSPLGQVHNGNGAPVNRAHYRLSTSFGSVGKYTLRVFKPAAMCRHGHCRVAASHSKPFSVVVGNSTYFVERRLHSLGVPVGTVDGVVDARAQQAFCAWRDMTGKKPNRSGLSKSLARSVMRHKHLPAPHRTNGIYVNKTCQMLFQVKHHNFHRVVWVSTGMAGHRTPNGTGHIFRKVRGWVESTLYPGAFMLDPMFFFPDRPGIALHGSVSNDLVEPYPASHACVRVWRPDVRKIFNESPLGTKVKVYGRY